MFLKIQRFALAFLAMASISYGVALAVPRNAFYMRNASAATLHFTYGCAGSKKTRTTYLYGHYGSWFWMNSGCYRYTIIKSTKNGAGVTTFKYGLNAGWRYELFWDDNRQAWNIRQANY